MSPEFFANWFVIDYWKWKRLGDQLYQTDAYTAYSVYLETCAMDEHHFSESARFAARTNKAIADRILWGS